MAKARRKSKAQTPSGQRVRRTIPGWIPVVVTVAVCLAITWYGGRYVLASRWKSQAELALRWGRIKESRGHLNRCLNLFPNDGSALLIAARAAERDHDAASANRFLERAALTLPDDVALERTLFRMRQGDLGDAAGMLDGIESQLDDPQSSIILDAIIEGALQSSQTAIAERALSFWDKTLKDDWAVAQALAWKGELAFRQGMPDVALQQLRAAVNAAPANDQTRLRLAEVLLQYGPQEAKTHLEYLDKKSPEQREIQIRLASCHRELGEYDEATTILDELLQKSDRDLAAMIERGRVALDLQDLHEAERWFRRAEALAPDHREVILGLVRCLQLAGKPSDAQTYRNKMAQLDANN
ncbi:MAG: tetratricopeptide repeat protein [Planctomycetaceae bacterium]|nr:tetratricopeptide repeat protein [Planctomycetaceae bacterium]